MGHMKWLALLVATQFVVLPAVGCSSKSEVIRSNNSSTLSEQPNATGSSPVTEQTLKLQASTTIPAIRSPKVKVKGIYVSAWSAVGNKFEQLVQLVEQTDLNAMVIDVKNDSGQVTYASAVPMVNSIGANSHVIIHDLPAKLKRLKDRGIYTIARIVVFKDPYLSNKKNEYAIKSRSGGIWRDNKGVAWVDPFKEAVWDYNIQVAKEAATLGFDEIQFDYVRFPENGSKVDREVIFDNPKMRTKAQDIEAFLVKAKEAVGAQAYISADVFGLTTSSTNDMGIGQDWSMISKQVHYISPMLYPSHYTNGMYGVKAPDLQPYAIVSKAISDANVKRSELTKTNPEIAEIRPWYQDFTATWVKPHKVYGKNDVYEQIKAARERGVDQFLLWNSNSNYTYR
ncbi:putative glycoside hydrolase [Paenibacillus aestuarii]|uniref:Glycoside hydrolase n=1 Tax=Paenibacillus aestuarii TaxID=516965 RepID=A0ABW0KDX4_9BACL|nr:putative glycoside hydrolase [Paenibacillus aestuarii]